jgi:hypothetical protein
VTEIGRVADDEAHAHALLGTVGSTFEPSVVEADAEAMTALGVDLGKIAAASQRASEQSLGRIRRDQGLRCRVVSAQNVAAAIARRRSRHTTRMVVNRIAWTLTTALFFLVAIALFVSGYNGYGGVFIAVACAAAVNLIPVDSAD